MIKHVYKSILRPIAFCFDPETIHESAMLALSVGSPLWNAIKTLFMIQNHRLQVNLAGLNFPNPVGLAAGFDKNAHALTVWHALGFGHVEIGTITGQAQPGNPKPRLFRYPEKKAIINRIGFNNDGADAIAQRLETITKQFTAPIPIGINIGKTKIVPLEEAVNDYVYSFKKLYPYGDYFTVNVSSPNTPNLRELQNKIELTQILSALQNENQAKKPIFLKIAPDVNDELLADIASVVEKQQITGFIATNTTISRDDFQPITPQTGGLSGAPLRQKATNIIRNLYQLTGGKIPIIGVGGIFTGKDAYEKILAGASLVQLYTGFIYEGPDVVKSICEELLDLLDQDGFQTVQDAIGKGIS